MTAGLDIGGYEQRPDWRSVRCVRVSQLEYPHSPAPATTDAGGAVCCAWRDTPQRGFEITPKTNMTNDFRRSASSPVTPRCSQMLS